MDGSAIESWRAGMSQITDVRVGGRCEHLLIDVVGLTILAVLCGADGFVAVETFAVGRSARVAATVLGVAERPSGTRHVQSRVGFDRPQTVFGRSGRLDRRAATDPEGACHRH